MRDRRSYAIVTAAYWVFTLTDGALRMLVLLHLHERGFAPLEIVSLFLFYEAVGVVANGLGGWIGAHCGLKHTLVLGLLIQTIACSLLVAGSAALPLALVTAAQALSGAAKDLTKMSAKSYVKLVVPDGDHGALLRWVTLLTGSKNTLKGAGFFLGGLLLSTAGFRAANAALAASLAAALVSVVMLLPRARTPARKPSSLRPFSTADRRIRWLSVARLFLFGARDVWFVLAVPVFLAADLGWSFSHVGAFLALWVVGYGVIQALAPTWLGKSGRVPDARGLGVWTSALLLPLAATWLALKSGARPDVALVAGLALFGVVFAANSALHSFLVVLYAARDRVALDVGFYYMANAAGRLLGTALSGAVFQAAGLGLPGLLACIACSAGLVIGAALACAPLRAAERRRFAPADDPCDAA